MKAILAIATNDLRVFLRDKSSYIWLFVIPLAFAYFMGFVSAGGPGDPKNARPEIAIINNDSGFMSQLFLDTLGSEGLNPVSSDSTESAKRGLEIPEGFTEKILSKEEVSMGFFKVGSDDDQRAFLSQVVLARAVVAFNAYLLEAATDSGVDGPLTEAAIRSVMEKGNPIALDARFAGRKPIPVGYNQSLPGILVMYLMINLMIFGGAGIASERRSGALRRLSVFPLTKGELLTGKLLGLMFLASVQIVVFVLLGQFAFGVNMGSNLTGILLTLLVLSWVGGSIGLLIGFMITAEEKVVGLSLIIGLPMAALGGCWWPLEIVSSEILQRVALMLPTGIALDALHQLITFGSDFSSVLGSIGLLTLFGLAANVAAVKQFRV